jgi:hypothetical protein
VKARQRISPRAMTIEICCASPASGEHAHWVCGRGPGHRGLHIDVEGQGAWNQEATR